MLYYTICVLNAQQLSRCKIAIVLMDLLGLGVENQDRGDREITPRVIFIPALFQIANFLQLWQQFFE